MSIAKMITRSAAAIFITASFNATGGDLVKINGGFMTGQMFLELRESERSAYVMGLVDGMFWAPVYGAPEARINKFAQCISEMNNKQLSAILEKYLRDHPEKWHYVANSALWWAIREKCAL